MTVRTLLMLTVMLGPAFGGTIRVPADVPTIQGAIDIAVDGDVVVVASGTYAENIDFLGKAILVHSETGAAYTEIRSGDTLVTFATGESRLSTLRGFTLRGGTGTDRDGYGFVGGAIYCEGASPTVEHNVILENTVEGYGGGIFSLDGSPYIHDNEIRQNAAIVGGGGIACFGGDPEIFYNLMEDNRSEGSAPDQGRGGALFGEGCRSLLFCFNCVFDNVSSLAGGGVFAEDAGALIEGNILTGNITGSHQGSGAGGAVCCVGDVRVNRNQMNANEVIHGGGGALWLDSGKGTAASNVMFDNISQNAPGAAILCRGGDHTLTNNTVTANEGASALHVASGSVEFAQGILWGNEGEEISVTVNAGLCVRYSDVEGGYAGIGNIDEDPRFLDPSKDDYRIPQLSPCVDAGDPDFEPCVMMDYYGYPRWLSGFLTELAIIDMGASEFDNVDMDIRGDFRPGGIMEIEVSGTAGVPATLIIGMGMDGMCHPASGALFFDMASPYLVLPWGTVPSLQQREIPSDIPVPTELLFQILARDPSARAGNTSNPQRLTIE